MRKIKVNAKVENLDRVLDTMHDILDSIPCPMKIMMQLDIAVEEIFVNVAHYAYAPNTGDVEITYDFNKETRIFKITMIDEGTKYDPLDKEDPDITLSAEERGIGGLGIFMTKKYMDEMNYQYMNKKNILTMTKLIEN